jgi:predicted deacylase
MAEIPADLPPGVYREAVELANEATFTSLELDAYQKVMDEIQQAREYGEGERAEGKAEGKAQAILAFLEARGVVVGSETRERIAACTDEAILNRWIARAAVATTAAEVIAGT